MRSVIFLPLALALSAASATAQERPACPDGSVACTPFVACILDSGETFAGYTTGADAGPLYALSDRGTICSGRWLRDDSGAGIARFGCDDGRTGQSAFTWIEPSTGTAIGVGTFGDGSRARFWSGGDLARHLADPGTQIDGTACNLDALAELF